MTHQQLDLFSANEPAKQGKKPEDGVAKQEIGMNVDLDKQETNVNTTITVIEPHKGKKRGRKSLKELADDPHVIQEIERMQLDKQYYSISEVASMFRVNSSLIRYWENEFDVLQPKKNRKGDRLFRQDDIQHLKLIYHLLRERKYTIEGAKQKLKEDKKIAARNFEMVQALQKVRSFLTELKEQL
ncbi:MerR family transcriptional regulator [Chitinophaga caeni]|nr:MerR family transcriptional regulator [Chitinophaga caeni]